jgi:integrase
LTPSVRAAICRNRTLRRFRQDDAEFIFPGIGKTGHLTEPKRAWKRILDRAKVSNVRVHDLRRTISNRLQRHTGAPIELVTRVLGHHSSGVTRRHYDPRDDSHVRAALEKNARALLSYLPDDESPARQKATSTPAG